MTRHFSNIRDDIKNLEENKAMLTEKVPFYEEQLKTLNEEKEKENKTKPDLM